MNHIAHFSEHYVTPIMRLFVFGFIVNLCMALFSIIRAALVVEIEQ